MPPLCTKDKPYLDVISESVNNPLRLAIGWAMVDPATLPPASVILAFWLGGAYHGRKKVLRIPGAFRLARERDADPVSCGLCEIYRKVAQRFVFQLCAAFELLPGDFHR